MESVREIKARLQNACIEFYFDMIVQPANSCEYYRATKNNETATTLYNLLCCKGEEKARVSVVNRASNFLNRTGF